MLKAWYYRLKTCNFAAMNKVKLLLGLIGLVFLANCSNEFDLVAEAEDIPVVYGLISRADTAHYIRIERAFVDPEISALEIAQRPDSLYYPNLGVRIERVNNTSESWTLTRVDGADEGYPRQSGVFANEPNWLYKFKLAPGEELVGGETYRLIIDRGDNFPAITAEAVIVSDIRISQPVTVKPQNWVYGDDINASNADISWRFQPDARFFDLKIRINIDRINLDDPDNPEDLSLIWTVTKNIKTDGDSRGERFRIPSVGLYQYIGSQLTAESNVEYDFKSYDYIIEGGGQELLDYINIGQANTGITSSQIVSNFTNLSEGLGVFSSRNSVSFDGFDLNSQSLDSLRRGVFTGDLKFR